MRTTSIQLVVLPEECYRCQQPTRAIAGILMPSGYADHRTFHEFDEVARLLAANLDERTLRGLGIGPIKKRRSRIRGSYLSNGCVHCDAILGSFPLWEGLQEFLSEGGGLEELVVQVLAIAPTSP